MTTLPHLTDLAHEIMLERGLQPDFSSEALRQLSEIDSPAPLPPGCQDLRLLLWCSIDNDDSHDLDQLTYAEEGEKGNIILWVAVADVDALVAKDTPIDTHARINTTSVYTPTKTFTMLPEKLSTNLTSLNEHEDRLAMVIKMEIDPAGVIGTTAIFPAAVHNHAQLRYSIIGPWLQKELPLPSKVQHLPGLEKTLKIQHSVAQRLKYKRHKEGSLTLESSEAEVKLTEQNQIVIQLPPHNLAHQLIEECMIAANTVMAQQFYEAKIPSLRRVVRVPKYWNKIVDTARNLGENLPLEPDSKALDLFLIHRKKIDPVSFPDLSLTIIKLLGRGEYIVENDTTVPVGHFALALLKYAHTTAPNRRFPDLIAQRQYKAFLRGEPAPYSISELRALAVHCTQQEDAATKVERQSNKCAAATVLSSSIGKIFKGIITGVGEKGTWIRIFQPAIEGKIIHGFEGLHVGDKISVRLVYVNIEKGYIDFSRS